MWFFCTAVQHLTKFNWPGASRGYSVIAELLVVLFLLLSIVKYVSDNIYVSFECICCICLNNWMWRTILCFEPFTNKRVLEIKDQMHPERKAELSGWQSREREGARKRRGYADSRECISAKISAYNMLLLIVYWQELITNHCDGSFYNDSRRSTNLWHSICWMML